MLFIFHNFNLLKFLKLAFLYNFGNYYNFVIIVIRLDRQIEESVTLSILMIQLDILIKLHISVNHKKTVSKVLSCLLLKFFSMLLVLLSGVQHSG